MLICQYFIETKSLKKNVCAPVHTVILVRDLDWLNDWLINDSDDNSDNKADNNDDDNNALTVYKFHHYKL